MSSPLTRLNKMLNWVKKDKTAKERDRRRLALETLEERALLAVTAAEYAEIAGLYSNLQLPAQQEDINIIEVTDLTQTSVQAALDEAASTAEDDFIVIRTSKDAYQLTLDGSALQISVDSSAFGAISIVSVGEKPLEIGINPYPTATMNVEKGAEVHFANLTFTGFDSENFRNERRGFLTHHWMTELTFDDMRLVDENGVLRCENFTFSDSEGANTEALTAGSLQIASRSETGTDYAVLFSGGYSADNNSVCYYDEIKNLYTILVEDYGLDRNNIYVIYADGLDEAADQNIGYPAQYYINSDMSFALSDHVFDATLESLQGVMNIIGGLMGDNDHLLFFTSDHGGGTDEAPTTTGEEVLYGWGCDISGTEFANAIFSVTRGYVTLVLNECYSGGILDDVIDPATGRCLSKRLANAGDATTKWYGMAAANHYESSWYSFNVNKGMIVHDSEDSFATNVLDALSKGGEDGVHFTITSDIFNYAKEEDFFVTDEIYENNCGLPAYQKEHPWGAGASFSVFVGAGDRYEGNDTRANAADLDIILGLQTFDALSIHQTDDLDYYKFRIMADGTENDSVRMDFVRADGDLGMILYDKSGKQVSVGVSGEDCETISLQGLAAGYYYLYVYGKDSAINDYSLSFTAPNPDLPDLTPNTPTRWSGSIVVATSPDATTDAETLNYGDNIYINASLINTGSADAGPFTVTLTFKNVYGYVVKTVKKTYTSLAAGRYVTFSLHEDDFYTLFKGFCRVSMTVDSNNTVQESNESNNVASKDFTVNLLKDAYESNETMKTAANLGTISESTSFSNLTIHQAGDIDYYKFTTIKTRGQDDYIEVLFKSRDGKMGMALYNEKGDQIRSYNDSNDGIKLSIAGLGAGTYYLFVCGQNFATNTYSLVFSTTTVENAPDLTGNAPDNWSGSIVLATKQGAIESASNITMGDTVYLSAVVTNSGTAAARAFAAKFELRDSSGNLLQTLTKNFKALDISESAFFTGSDAYNFGSLAAGKYTVTATLDIGGVVTELNEKNNVYEQTFSVSPPIDHYESNDTMKTASDLGVINGSLSISDLSIHISGDDDYYKFTIADTGGESDCIQMFSKYIDGDIEIRLYDETKEEIDCSVSSNDVETVSLKGLAAGTYYLYVYGYRDAVNSYSLKFQTPRVEDHPDLRSYRLFEWTDAIVLATEPGATVSAPYILPGETVYLSAGFINSGTLASEAFTVQFELKDSAGNVLQTLTKDFNGLAVSETVSFTGDEVFNFGSLEEGGYTVTATVLYDGAELSKENNVYSLYFTVSPYEPNDTKETAYDLYVVNGNLTIPYLTINGEEDEDYFKFTTVTMGGESDYIQILFQHLDGDLDLMLYDEDDAWIGSFSCADNETISLEGIEADTYYIRVFGYNGAKNYYTLVINTTPVEDNPDLKPYIPSDWNSEKQTYSKNKIVLSPEPGATQTNPNMTSVDKIYFSTGVINYGTRPSEAFTVRFDLKDSNGTVLQTVTKNFDALDIKESFYFVGDETCCFNPVAAGEYTITMTIDPENKIAEMREDNNTCSVTFTVVDPIIITAAELSNNTPQVGNVIKVKTTPSDAAVSYQWYRGSEAIEGETRAGYQAAAEDVGCYLTVKIKGTGIYRGEFTLTTASVVAEAAAPLVVTTLADTVDASDGVLSLREAVAQVTEGGVILFDSPLAGGTITLKSGLAITTLMTIDASSLKNGITLDFNGSGNINVNGGDDYYSVKLKNLRIQNGYDVSMGGGVRLASYLALTMTNCVVCKCNSYFGTGGGIDCGVKTKLELRNCVVANNTAGFDGGGIWSQATVHLYNTIIVQNKANNKVNDFKSVLGTTAAYNCLSSYEFGESRNNLVYDTSRVLFTDAANGDYTLCPGSQAINVGSSGYVTTETDLAGNPRIVGASVDMGAYEYQSVVTPLDTPTNLTASSYGANRHLICWDEVPNAGSYQLSYSVDLKTWKTATAYENSYVVSGLTYGSVVSYRVQALGDGENYLNSEISEDISLRVCPMDINASGTIDLGDYAILSSAWLSSKGDANWDARSDINGDGRVNMADYTYLSINYMKNAGSDDLIYPAVFDETDANPANLDDDAFDFLDDEILEVFAEDSNLLDVF